MQINFIINRIYKTSHECRNCSFNPLMFITRWGELESWVFGSSFWFVWAARGRTGMVRSWVVGWDLLGVLIHKLKSLTPDWHFKPVGWSLVIIDITEFAWFGLTESFFSFIQKAQWISVQQVKKGQRPRGRRSLMRFWIPSREGLEKVIQLNATM